VKGKPPDHTLPDTTQRKGEKKPCVVHYMIYIDEDGWKGNRVGYVVKFSTHSDLVSVTHSLQSAST